MNKNFIPIAAALTLMLVCAGCNKSGKLSQLSTFAPTNGPVELKVKWPPGERVVQDMDMTQDMEFSVPGHCRFKMWNTVSCTVRYIVDMSNFP